MVFHWFSICFPYVPCREGVTLWALVGRGWVHVLRLKARRRQELMLEAIAGMLMPRATRRMNSTK